MHRKGQAPSRRRCIEMLSAGFALPKAGAVGQWWPWWNAAYGGGPPPPPFVCPSYGDSVQLARLNPTPGSGSIAWATSSDGSKIVGADYSVTPRQVPVVWTSAGTVVTPLSMPATYITGIAYGISPDGLTIVGTVSTTAGGSGELGANPKACVWNSGVPTVLAPNGALDTAAARCVSDDGTKIGGFSWPNGGSFLPTSWSSGTPTQLTGGGGGDGTIYACDSTGTIFVGDLRGFYVANGITVWRNGVAENPPLGGWSVSSPGSLICGISRDGTVITTTAADLDGFFHTVKWTYSGGVWGALVSLAGGNPDSFTGDSISPDGNIIVGRQFGGSPEYVPQEFCGGAVTQLSVPQPQGTAGSDLMTGVAADNSLIIGEIFDVPTSQNTAAFWPKL